MQKGDHSAGKGDIYRAVHAKIDGRAFEDLPASEKLEIAQMTAGKNIDKYLSGEIESSQMMIDAKRAYLAATKFYGQSKEQAAFAKKPSKLEKETVNLSDPIEHFMPHLGEIIGNFSAYEKATLNKLWDLLDEIPHPQEAKKLAQEAKTMLSQLPGDHPLNAYYENIVKS